MTTKDTVEFLISNTDKRLLNVMPNLNISSAKESNYSTAKTSNSEKIKSLRSVNPVSNKTVNIPENLTRSLLETKEWRYKLLVLEAEQIQHSSNNFSDCAVSSDETNRKKLDNKIDKNFSLCVSKTNVDVAPMSTTKILDSSRRINLVKEKQIDKSEMLSDTTVTEYKIIKEPDVKSHRDTQKFSTLIRNQDENDSSDYELNNTLSENQLGVENPDKQTYHKQDSHSNFVEHKSIRSESLINIQSTNDNRNEKPKQKNYFAKEKSFFQRNLVNSFADNKTDKLNSKVNQGSMPVQNLISNFKNFQKTNSIEHLMTPNTCQSSRATYANFEFEQFKLVLEKQSLNYDIFNTESTCLLNIDYEVSDMSIDMFLVYVAEFLEITKRSLSAYHEFFHEIVEFGLGSSTLSYKNKNVIQTLLELIYIWIFKPITATANQSLAEHEKLLLEQTIDVAFCEYSTLAKYEIKKLHERLSVSLIDSLKKKKLIMDCGVFNFQNKQIFNKTIMGLTSVFGYIKQTFLDNKSNTYRRKNTVIENLLELSNQNEVKLFSEKWNNLFTSKLKTFVYAVDRINDLHNIYNKLVRLQKNENRQTFAIIMDKWIDSQFEAVDVVLNKKLDNAEIIMDNVEYLVQNNLLPMSFLKGGYVDSSIRVKDKAYRPVKLPLPSIINRLGCYVLMPAIAITSGQYINNLPLDIIKLCIGKNVCKCGYCEFCYIQKDYVLLTIFPTFKSRVDGVRFFLLDETQTNPFS